MAKLTSQIKQNQFVFSFFFSLLLFYLIPWREGFIGDIW